MSEAQIPLTIHSLTEASLYAMLSACADCGGQLWPLVAESTGPDSDHCLKLAVTCEDCSHTGRITFDTSAVEPSEAAGGMQAWSQGAEAGRVHPINPTEESSRVIDVAGWLGLYELLTAGADARPEQVGNPQRGLIRQLRIQAGRCLGEALKFYDADNDLPPSEAFYCEESRRRFREHPELFVRERLVNLRAKMPVDRGAENKRP